MKKVLLTLILIVMMLGLSSLVYADEIEQNSEEEAVEIIASGDCGESITWSLDYKGTLLIQGFGEMDQPEWRPYKEQIKCVVIAEGVTSICDYAFSDYDQLESVDLPDTLTRIGSWTFDRCDKLKAIVIPDQVTYIGTYAFCYLENLESLTLPKNLKVLGNRAIGSNIKLHQIELPENLEEIGEFCFAATALETIHIPDKVNKISRCTFDNCHSLKSVELPETLSEIEEAAFEGCSSLEYIDIPNGVKQIENTTFYGCESLEQIQIPDSVEIIGTHAFEHCDSLKAIALPEGVRIIDSGAFSFCRSLEHITLPDILKFIGDEAFEYCDCLKTVKIPATVAGIGQYLFGIDRQDFPVSYDQYAIIGWAGSVAESYALENNIVFVPVQEETGLPFNDVYINDWYLESVRLMEENGYMTGLTLSVFGPAESLSRAQFATILYRIAVYPDTDYTDAFPDVPADTWYSKPIMWASDAGIVTGYQNGTFGPADNITREQIAVMLYRYAGYCGFDTEIKVDISDYPDAEKVSDWAVDAMRWAVASGVIQGKDGGKYLDPQGSTSRAECAEMMMRFLNV